MRVEGPNVSAGSEGYDLCILSYMYGLLEDNCKLS